MAIEAVRVKFGYTQTTFHKTDFIRIVWCSSE